MDGLLGAAGGGAEAIAPETGEGGAALLLAEAERLAEPLSGVDPELDALAARLAALRLEAEDARRRAAPLLRTRSRPSRAASSEVEERLELYDRLERKHGGSVAAVLAHAEHCRAERDRLERAEVETERAQAALRRGRGGARRAGRTAGRCPRARPLRGWRAGPDGAGGAGDGGRRLRGRARSRATSSGPRAPSAWS